MDENLIQAGDHALEKSDNLRISQQRQQAELRRNGQMPATYVRTDAEQGLIEVADIYGGRAFLQDQGSLSNRAIADGEEVRLYQDGRSTGYQAADWKPGRSASGSGGAGGGSGGNGDGDDGSGSGGAGGGSGENGDGGDPPPYCAIQCFWYRGSPCEVSDDPEDYFPGLPDGISGTLYYVGYIIALGEDRLLQRDLTTPFSIVRVTPSQYDIEYIADTPLGEIELYFGNGSIPPLGIRDLRFVPDGEDDPGPPLPLGPPPGSDPGKWHAICSENPPIRYSVNTGGACEIVSVWDQESSAKRPITKLDFEKGTGQYYVRCQEEGPP